MKYTNPEFRARAANGFNIVVAGTAFGCGSSREMAVLALKGKPSVSFIILFLLEHIDKTAQLGCGINCVIAKSYSFIYDRNQYALGLLGITLSDDDFYANIQDGAHVSVDLNESVIIVDEKRFPFKLSQMERALIEVGGITSAFLKFGKHLFDYLRTPMASPKALREISSLEDNVPYTNW